MTVCSGLIMYFECGTAILYKFTKILETYSTKYEKFWSLCQAPTWWLARSVWDWPEKEAFRLPLTMSQWMTSQCHCCLHRHVRQHCCRSGYGFRLVCSWGTSLWSWNAKKVIRVLGLGYDLMGTLPWQAVTRGLLFEEKNPQNCMVIVVPLTHFRNES